MMAIVAPVVSFGALRVASTAILRLRAATRQVAIHVEVTLNACFVLISIVWASGTQICLATVSARASDGPSSQVVERVDHSLRTASRVRVTTRQAQFVVRDVWVAASGVSWAAVVGRGTLDPLGAPGTIAWGDIV